MGWSHRLGVRTLASHAGNRGSNPLGTAKVYRFSTKALGYPLGYQGFSFINTNLSYYVALKYAPPEYFTIERMGMR